MAFFQNEVKMPCHHWRLLSTEDQSTFRQLHVHFLQQQKDHLKDRRNNSFFNDILCLMKYIDYSSVRRDDRAICVGLAFSGPFVCVNTQQLKTILGRCKSSINNSFQQIGYDAVKNKSKSKEAVLAIIPSLIAEQSTLRKWTVRCASESATCCFYSYYQTPQLPFISDEDLYDDKKSVQGSMLLFSQSQANKSKSSNSNNSSSIKNFVYRDFDSREQMTSSIAQQQQQQNSFFSNVPNQTDFLSQIPANNFNRPQPFVLSPMNFNIGSVNSAFKAFPPMNFNQSSVGPSQASISIVTSPPEGIQKVNSEENFFSNQQDDNDDQTSADELFTQSQQVFAKKERHRNQQQFDLSFYADEEMPIPDITPSFSTNYLTEFGENDDFDFDVGDSIVNPSKTTNSMNFNIARSQSAFISSIGDFF